jgi:hypothetical protein
MKLSDLKRINLDDVYWYFRLGRSKKKLSVVDMREEISKYIRNPIFFLSTGRCGTMWFSELLEKDNTLMVLHNPKPALAHQSKIAYEILSKDKITSNELDLLKENFLASREQLLRYSYKTQKRYVETNNYISFFAPILKLVFPDAKFVHLYRHPGQFVRSGIRRNYFTEGNHDDLKRIHPLSCDQKEKWIAFNRIQKTSWLWEETNHFIEKFKAQNKESCFSFNFNELNLENIIDLLDFLEISIPVHEIKKALSKNYNIQKTGSFQSYESWDEQMKEDLKDICEDLMKQYNYL